MDEKQFERIAKALADPGRFEILATIAHERELSCGQIAERFPIGQPTVSHHLKVLADAELVNVRRAGQHAFFSARHEEIKAYSQLLVSRLVRNPKPKRKPEET